MIGIDFGTTNSAIAHVLTGEKPAPIADPHTSQNILPSFVYYETPDKIIVGEKAKSQYYELAAKGGSIIFRSMKRKLKQKRSYNIFGSIVEETDLAAHIFSELKKRGEALRNEPVQEAVVTIPVYFDADQRNAVRTAAEKAGIRVKGFLHEPVAVAYPILQKTLHTQHVLIFDWGGGTLDISLLRVDNGMIYELEVGGNEELGGDDIDLCIADNTFSKFLKENTVKKFILKDQPTCFQRLISRSETAKIQLSDALTTNTSIDIPAFIDNRDLSRIISKLDFEKMTNLLFGEAIEHVIETLKKVKMKSSEIDLVILAGGSSRFPTLIRRMEELFGTQKITTLSNSDTCVAEGAALVSFHNVDPVLSIPVGIELSQGYIHNFLPKGTKLNGHIKEQIQFVVTDPRAGVANIKVFESESGAPYDANSRQKGLLMVPVDKIHPEKINVIYEMDNNQCLTLKAYGLNTQKVVECKIKDIKVGYKIKN